MSTDAPLQIEAANPNFNENKALVPRPEMHVVPSQSHTGPIAPYQPTAGTPLYQDRQSIPPYDIPSAAVGGEGGGGGIPVSFAAAEKQTEFETVGQNVSLEQYGDGVLGLKNAKTKVKGKRTEQIIVAQDEQGNMRMLKRTHVELCIYQEIAEVLVTDARRFAASQPRITNAEGDTDVEPTCCEKSIDLCCQSLVCSFGQNPFKAGAHPVKKKELMNPTLRRGRAKGWSIYSHLVFPLVGDVIRDFWVLFQLLFVLVMLSLSIATFATAADNYQVFNALHLALSILAVVLAAVDGCMTFMHCSTCKACLNRYHAKKRRTTDTFSPEPESQNSATSDKQNACFKCSIRSKKVLDFVRLLLTEFILVPIIFCDMFEVATGNGFDSFEVSHRLGFSLMVFDGVGFLIFVFLIRLLILGRSIHSVQRAHPSESEGRNLYTNKDYGIDPSIKKNSLKIQIVFFLHVFGQILGQTLMLVAVGAKIAYDNRDFRPTNTLPTVTPYLWYMMVATYVLPIFGLSTFFIVNNYWIQQFLVGLCISFFKLLQIAEDDKQWVSSVGKEKQSEVISNFVHIRKLEDEYKKVRGTKFCEKFIYPFKSPVLVICCLAYMLSQLAFVVCGGISINEMGKPETVYLNDGGWFFYYYIAAAVGVIVNIYSFLVAGIWLAIIIGILVAVAIVIMLCCLLFCCAAMGDN